MFTFTDRLFLGSSDDPSIYLPIRNFGERHNIEIPASEVIAFENDYVKLLLIAF